MACNDNKLRTDAGVEPEHTLPAHTVVELYWRRVFAQAIRSQRRPQYAEDRLAARRRRPRTPAGRLIHGTRLFECLEPEPVDVWTKNGAGESHYLHGVVHTIHENSIPEVGTERRRDGFKGLKTFFF